jgi:hypothetical protein
VGVTIGLQAGPLPWPTRPAGRRFSSC